MTPRPDAVQQEKIHVSAAGRQVFGGLERVRVIRGIRVRSLPLPLPLLLGGLVGFRSPDLERPGPAG